MGASRYGTKAARKGPLALWRPQRGHGMEVTSQWHKLGAAEGGTCQGTERKRRCEGDSPSGRDGKGRKGGHAKCFGAGILEIIEASKGIRGETRGCSINEVRVPGVLKNLLEGAFHCGYR